MKKVNKKLVSLLLALMCLLSCINTGAVFAREGAITDHQAIVLVLDTSGSMKGSPITNLKSAAFEFCKKIIAADKNNQIAIVTFASSQKTYDFSNNLLELSKTISNISASGGTNMANAIKSADNLLQGDKVKAGYVKSIVTMADGEPLDYTKTVSTATALFSNYNMYSIGFFSRSNESAKNLLKSIQNCGYYEANNVNDLIDEFVKIANDILNPFTTTLAYEEISYNENTETPGSYTYKYKIKASVKNGNPKPAKNVKVAINLGEGVILSVGSQQEMTIDTLEANDTKEFTWDVELPMIVLGVTPYKEYSITASSDNTVDITSYDKIIIDTHDIPSPKNNELDFSKDVWSFGNFGGPLYMTTTDKQSLLFNLSSHEKASINSKINESRGNKQDEGGHCYGMSVTTILSKMGIINPCTRQDGTNCLHDITMNPLDDDNIESLITFYQCTFKLNNIHIAEKKFSLKNNKEKISDLIKQADSVKIGGSPVLIWFDYLSRNEDGSINMNKDYGSGHAVVGYAYQPGTYNWDNHDYNGRILIYDNNPLDDGSGDVFEDNRCLYINSNTGEWTFPEYDLANSYSFGELCLVTNDTELLSTKDIDTATSNYDATLEANATTRFIIRNKKGSYNSMDIFNNKVKDFRVSFTPQGNSSTPQISMPNNMDYTVENVNKNEELDYNLNYRGNSFLSAKATSVDNANFTYNGQVSLTNNKQDYSIASTVDNSPLQWYTIQVSGDKTTNPTLTPTKTGYIFEGDNMDNITITGTSDTQTKELTFTTTEDKVSIGENKNELTVSIDKDNDGTYETVIANSGNKNNEKETAELKNLKTENFKLTPVFASSVRDYTSTVDYSVSKVSLTPTLEKGTTATISVNSSKAIAFDKKQTVDLKVGENKIEIVVSGDNLVSSKYTIIVTRSKAKEVKSQNNNSNNNTNNNKTNYTDKSPNTGDYIAKMSLVTAFVIISLGIILFARLHLKTKRKKDL